MEAKLSATKPSGNVPTGMNGSRLSPKAGGGDGLRSEGICSYPPYIATFEIGRLSEGTYTLQVDYRYAQLGVPGTATETIGIIDFNVSQAPGSVSASPVPVLGRFGIIGLGLLLIAGAFVARAGVRRETYPFVYPPARVRESDLSD
jgi:hypothetical protein